MLSAAFPIAVSRETSPKIAIPAAECGITIGILIIPINRFLKRNVFLAMMYANGTAKSVLIAVAATETQIVTKMLFVTCLSCVDLNIACKSVEKNILRIGAKINIKANPPNKMRKILFLPVFTKKLLSIN